MLAIRRHITVLLATLVTALLASSGVLADPVSDTRKQLFENQRNLITLRKEKEAYAKELQAAQAKRNNSSANETANTEALDIDALDAEILDLEDSIDIAKTMIRNVSELVARQRLLLATLESGTPPTALDIALNKALNSNLPELLKNLSNDKAARKDIARLKILLKKQARLDAKPSTNSNAVSVAQEQQVAEDEFLRLLALFSGGNADEAEDKTITIAGTDGDTAYSEDDILSYLGHEQYHMETMVHSGKMTFTVDGRPWELDVPKEEDKATYVLIYDTGKEAPRLVMFNKSLLLE
ncbi:hypothetical protein [Oceanicoccus sagamiensis]|uniref:DUF3450 domain-containing protein n=1 Tax=Oceanicoccus sagamiensis TaxID=716816 RepID=A0A1X9N7A2_9GAMM|nr:hypothetical protein [Oceanicoccus sagamiensis]ARN73566.1 hypothetical protein BST96_05190 [Oceanicoccus sagamiensis]